MIIREFEFTLKDGRKALIRSPKEEDIQGMLDYLYQSAEETDFVLRYPEECSRYTAEGERELFDRINRSDTAAMLVCIVEGIVAGNCQITWNNRIKTRHRASVAIALLRDYWNQGIGSALLSSLNSFAAGNGIELISLEVRSDNAAAIHLYEKYGFVKTGYFPAFFKIGDTYHDFDLMVLDLRNRQ